MDNSLIPTEKYLQEERERQDIAHTRDLSLIDCSIIHSSCITNLCPLRVISKEMLFTHTKEYYSAFKERDTFPTTCGNVDKSGGHCAV